MLALETMANGRHTHFDDDSDTEEQSQNILTLAKASDLCPKPYRLVAKNQNITELADLSSLSALDYVDLSFNSLTSLDGIHHPRLKTLIVSRNKISRLRPIYNASNIRVLNLSENLIPDLEWIPQTTFAPFLLTLVVSSNQLRNLSGLLTLSSLQTLVISNNQIEDITPVTQLKSLVKLSASKNEIRALPSLSTLEKLAELRLAHNFIDAVPTTRVPSLKILDIGHNRLSDIDSLPMFAPSLDHINLRQNPVCQRNDLEKYVKTLLPGLEVIDGQRISGGSRKVRVNRVRRAVGFQIEHDRKFARMPSEYYLKRLRKIGPKEDPVRGEGDIQTKIIAPTPKRKRAMISNEEVEEIDAGKFVEMAKQRLQKGQASQTESKVTVHDSLQSSEERKDKRKKRKQTEESEKVTPFKIESFGDGGASRW